MASDRSQYNRALRRWDSLHDQQAYSAPVNDGDVAILYSDYVMGNKDEKEIEWNAFREEAYNIATLLGARGISSEVFDAFTLDDAAEVLADPDFSSIVVIGNGNLSETYAHGGTSFDWRFVAEHATHLKTGRFTQRHCGQAIRELSVPLGTFALCDHSSVYAAYDTYLPTTMTDEYEAAIQRLHPYTRLGYRALKNMFINMNKPKGEEDE